ncbi:SRPBCC family protein [Streptomyces apocyni]|uniref:SRPBCC family protein n=1 Tax=Streptomyces apocyni TaxID=2654677 RepID=UPI0012E9DFFF|nr:SRPBCC family protein [Streptomyces apocyni]
MTAVRESIEIDCPPEQVFAYVTDASHLPEWQESAVEAHRIGDAPVSPGSRAEVTRRIGRREMPMKLEYAEVDAPRSWFVRGVEGPVRPQVHGTVEPLDEGRRSRLTLDIDFEGHGMGKMLVPLVVRPHMRKEVPRNERKLKDLLEQRAA